MQRSRKGNWKRNTHAYPSVANETALYAGRITIDSRQAVKTSPKWRDLKRKTICDCYITVGMEADGGDQLENSFVEENGAWFF